MTTDLVDGSVYPPPPADVPVDLTKPTAAYTRQAWIASFAVLAFVAGYFGLTWWFGRTTWKLVRIGLGGGSDAFISILLAVASAFLFLFLFKGLFSIRHGRDPSLVELTRDEQPELFAFVHRVARDAGAPTPHRVFLSPRVNAAVFYDLSLRNLLLPTRKNLEIGLGLVNVLTLDELKAVIAHEFGHFAQRTMAVGRWVYTAQQVAGHIVGARGWLDSALGVLSRIDIRIAWIGWLMRLMVWSIRAVLDTAFRGILLAQRAMSRHMEFQADLVAVSLTGSDSLVHGLHKLGAADDAAERAAGFMHNQLMQGRATEDLYALQSRFLSRLREIYDDETLGQAPPLPEQGRPGHRVFKDQLAQPPAMWSTHPPNREREENAKARYLPSTLDPRSSWTLFSDADAVRRRLTRQLLEQMAEAAGKELPGEPEPLEETLERLDGVLDKPPLERRYRGAYLGRSVVRATDDAGKLFDPVEEDPEQIRQALLALYPDALADELEALREVGQEVGLLKALKDGILDAPGGVIQHRGEEIPRRQLDDVIERVQAELTAAREVVQARDRACRTAHRSAARALGRGWEQHHLALVSLLHYAAHSEADLDDAAGWLHNTFQVVLADGRVTSAERQRMLTCSEEVHRLMRDFWDHRGDVRLPADLAEELEIETWAAALPKTFDFAAPSLANLGDWLGAVQSWIDAFKGSLGVLADRALERLLALEDHLRTCTLEGTDPGDAPEPAAVPKSYWTRPLGTEREPQKKLGLWDRFVLAEGWFPGTLRLVVALAVLTPALLFSGGVGMAKVIVYNGLGVPVRVQIGETIRAIQPGATARFEHPEESAVPVRTATMDGRVVERFEANLSNFVMDQVYNVASAAPLVEWTQTYGSTQEREPTLVGAPRWHRSRADHLFTEPPESISTSGSGGSREVLSGMADQAPVVQLNALGAAPADDLVRAHLRWDAVDDPDFGVWLMLAAQLLPDFEQLLLDRIEAAPRDVMLRRLEMDHLDRDAACETHRNEAAERADDPDSVYLLARCTAEGPERVAAFAQGHQRFPDHPWLAMAAGYDLVTERRWAEAQAALEPLITRLPQTGEWTALELARVRRVVAGAPWAANLSDLVPVSAALESMVNAESPQPQYDDGWTAWRLLAQGQYSLALDEAGDPQVRANVLRMAAASEGASPKLIAEAFALPPSDGIDRDSVWASLALAAREGQDTAPLSGLAAELGDEPEEVERLLGLLDADALRAAPERMHVARQGQQAFLQGQALVMGIVLLGDDAPAAWRWEARALLFAPERPVFSVPKQAPRAKDR